VRALVRALVLVGAFAILVAACGPAGTTPPAGARPPVAPSSASSSAPSSAPSAAPSATPSSALPTSPVSGIVVKVDALSLTDVRGFTLRTPDGRELAFTIGVLENGTVFPPAHLSEHLATASPVKVTFHVEGERLVVTRIEDGG
jgi:hypothetical protein